MDECPNSNQQPPLFGEKSVKESTYTLLLDSANRQIQFNIACDNDSSLLKRGSQQACFTCVLFPDPYMGNYAKARKLCSTGNRLGITGPYSSVEIPKMSGRSKKSTELLDIFLV
ncbi:hypothetical protein CAEBREN_24178 [Caenorhabditis brenneri]|uniref:Uncharacterized protein n=1 Tax=Caenorhabditis brenneri TaxID=135651 RepID=G0PFC4_CAEBE|nr:hypothetical protein CAEBREN_24178 [Caenorhabditis brenneri]